MRTRVCIVGATGKFGRSIITRADSEVIISGAVASDSNRFIGKTLNEARLADSDTIIRGASEVLRAAADSEIVLFVSKPDADLANIPPIIELKKKVIVGTTGFTEAQAQTLKSLLKRVPSMFTSNFSVGANIMFRTARFLSQFSSLYDFSIVEEHHKTKIDAPSGTAKALFNSLNQNSTLKTVTDRTVKPQRTPNEVEVFSLRAGGIPGIHQLIMSGENDMIRMEHIAFSSASAADGALLACKWLSSKNEAAIYSMDDVLGLR